MTKVQAIQKHGRMLGINAKTPTFGWLKTKSSSPEYHINNISKYVDFDNCFNVYTFADGTPYGIEED